MGTAWERHAMFESALKGTLCTINTITGDIHQCRIQVLRALSVQ